MWMGDSGRASQSHTQGTCAARLPQVALRHVRCWVHPRRRAPVRGPRRVTPADLVGCHTHDERRVVYPRPLSVVAQRRASRDLGSLMGA